MSLCLETPETERPLARSNIQGAEIYTGEWVVSWRICWGFHLTFQAAPRRKKNQLKIERSLISCFESNLLTPELEVTLTHRSAVCRLQESTMVNQWYAWYANIWCKGGAMNGVSLRLSGPKEPTWLRRIVHMVWNSENNYKARLVSAERDEHKS